jgi:monoamine oxidase
MTHDARGPRKRVCVIGAGISGLTAAYELASCDHSVVVLEASHRPGGRIRTARFSDGSHGELGAMRIPANHHATLHYVEAFGLDTQPFINSNPAAKYCIRGATVARNEWERLAERFALPPHERRDPLAVYEMLMHKAMAMLSTEEKRQLFVGNFSAGQVKAYDAQTLWQFLRRWLSPEAIQFLGHATGMIWYEHASFLEALVDYFGLFRIDSVQLTDGMDALTTAFAAHLGEAIHYDACVSAVSIRDDGVDVIWESPEGTCTERFDYAICAVPAPRAAAIDFTPRLPYTQLDALRRLTYASGTKTLLHCRTRPWEHMDGIYGGGSFTDLAIQQCWYPSDNARAAETELAVAFTGDDPDAAGGGYSRAPAAWAARSLERSHGPGVLTAAYMWEANAQRFASLSTSERTALVMFDIAKLHPEVLSEVEDVTHIVWDDEVGGGTYAFYAPGDYQRFHGLMRQPFPHQQPRVFFAGEHLAISHAWIQGAVQTGWDAASHVVTMGSGRETTLCPALADAGGAA